MATTQNEDRLTTVRAEVIRLVSVSMTFAEMDALISGTEKALDYGNVLNPTEAAVMRDLASEVRRIR